MRKTIWTIIILALAGGIIFITNRPEKLPLATTEPEKAEVSAPTEQPKEAPKKQEFPPPAPATTIIEPQPTPTVLLPHLTASGQSGADTGIVVLPPVKQSLLDILFPKAYATSKLSHVMTYLSTDPKNGSQNQIFFYELDTKRTGQLTNESGFISMDIRIIDAPVSAVLYYTKSSFKFVRFSGGEATRLSGLSPGANNYFAISPDHERLAYFDEQARIVVRDLASVNLDVIKIYPNPLSGTDVSPMVYSADGSNLFMTKRKSITVDGIPVGANDIVSFDLDSGATKTIVSGTTQTRPLTSPPNDSHIYYADYSHFPTFEASMNKLDPSTGIKTSIKGDSAWKGLYLKDRVLITQTAKGLNPGFITFSAIEYNFGTGQSSKHFSVDVETHPTKTTNPFFIGFGKNENEVLLVTMVVEGGTLQNHTYHQYNIQSGQLTTLFSAPFILTTDTPRG